MFRKDEAYKDDVNPSLWFAVDVQRCHFEASLYERVSGGFDLYLFLPTSEFEGLEIPQITWLRNEATGTEFIFIDSFNDAKAGLNLKVDAENRLREWLRTSLGIESKPTNKFKKLFGRGNT